MRITLYGRRDCHLCEEMEKALTALRAESTFEWITIDVDSDPVLQSQYGLRVPLLVDDEGTPICKYFFDEKAVREALAVK